MLFESKNVFFHFYVTAGSQINTSKSMLKRLLGSRESKLGQECREWMLEHAAQLLAYARMQMDNEGDAEMMLTRVSQKVLRSYCAGKVNKEGLLPYTLKSLRNAAIDEKTELAKRTKAEQLYEKSRSVGSPHFEPEDAHVHATALLQRLPNELSEVVRLKIWGELTYAQIAEQLSITEAAVRFRYHKGIEQVRLQMRK